tara:strand:+ start:101 stop:325 length:225 start_codon:yes stop_codon:yes gene_type:complete
MKKTQKIIHQFKNSRENVEKEMDDLIDKAIEVKSKLIIEYIPYVSLKEIDAIYDLVVKSLSEEEKPEISNDLPF